MQSLNKLQSDFTDFNLSSGIKKLDESLYGNDGFKPGIYDFSNSINRISLGCYELIFNICINLVNSYPQSKILILQSFNKLPLFKLCNNINNNDSLLDKIDIIDYENLNDLIILFKNDSSFIKNYKLIIIDSFSNVYSHSIGNLRKGVNLNNSLIINFYKSIKKLFYLMQKNCAHNSALVFTINSSMEIFNQRFLIQEEEEEDDDDEDDDDDEEEMGSDNSNHIQEPKKEQFINQQILVPTISLKSDINAYFNNRIILFNDWILENSNNELVSGLNFKNNLDILSDSFHSLRNNKLKSLPHFLCLSPLNNTSVTGFFLVNNSNSQILDIENINNNNFLDEVPDSQNA